MKQVLFALMVLPLLSYAAWAVTGTDIAPGDACSNENAVTMTANPTGSGGYILTCESSVWVATISGGTPTANEHLATKDYVDTAVAAAGGGMLKVYHSDGVTLFGTVTGVTAAGCAGVAYVDTTGLIHTTLGVTRCNSYPISPVYFYSTNCSGSVQGIENGYRSGYTCTGSGNCTTGFKATYNGPLYFRSYSSVRDSSGNCTNGSASKNLQNPSTALPQCGLTPCIVK